MVSTKPSANIALNHERLQTPPKARDTPSQWSGRNKSRRGKARGPGEKEIKLSACAGGVASDDGRSRGVADNLSERTREVGLLPTGSTRPEPLHFSALPTNKQETAPEEIICNRVQDTAHPRTDPKEGVQGVCRGNQSAGAGGGAGGEVDRVFRGGDARLVRR